MTGPVGMVTGRIRRVQDSARQTRAAVTRPKPPVEVDTGRTLPAWMLRAGCLVAGVATMIILNPGVVPAVLLSAILLVVVLHPTAATGAVFAGGLGFFWMIMPTPDFGAGQFALLALTHLTWALSGTISALPLRTKIEWAALRPPLARFVIIDVISQLLLIGAQLLRLAAPGTGGPVAGALVLACAVVLAIAAWLIMPRLHRL